MAQTALAQLNALLVPPTVAASLIGNTGAAVPTFADPQSVPLVFFIVTHTLFPFVGSSFCSLLHAYPQTLPHVSCTIPKMLFQMQKK